MFELLEWRVKLFINIREFFLQSLELVLKISLAFELVSNFVLDFDKLILPSVDVLFGFHEENLLLLIMLFDRPNQSIFPVFEHFNH